MTSLQLQDRKCARNHFLLDIEYIFTFAINHNHPVIVILTFFLQKIAKLNKKSM